MPTYSSHRPQAPGSDSGSFWMVAVLLLGLGIAVIGFFAVMMWADTRDARDATPTTAASSMADMPGMTSGSTGALQSSGLQSYADAAPANADELATAHKPYPAALPAAPAGPVANVDLKLTDIKVQIA